MNEHTESDKYGNIGVTRLLVFGNLVFKSGNKMLPHWAMYSLPQPFRSKSYSSSETTEGKCYLATSLNCLLFPHHFNSIFFLSEDICSAYCYQLPQSLRWESIRPEWLMLASSLLHLGNILYAEAFFCMLSWYNSLMLRYCAVLSILCCLCKTKFLSMISYKRNSLCLRTVCRQHTITRLFTIGVDDATNSSINVSVVLNKLYLCHQIKDGRRRKGRFCICTPSQQISAVSDIMNES